MATPPRGNVSDVRLNDLANCRAALQSEKDPRFQNVKMYLAGTIYYLYYEDPSERPFSSILPRYADLDVKDVISRRTSMASQVARRPDTPTDSRSAVLSPPAAASMPDSATHSHPTSPNAVVMVDLSAAAVAARGAESPGGRVGGGGGGGDRSATTPVTAAPITPRSATATPKRLAKKPLKRVLMEEMDPSRFSEIILRRTVFLEHIPNAYDKAINRAFETMMVDLGLPDVVEDQP